MVLCYFNKISWLIQEKAKIQPYEMFEYHRENLLKSILCPFGANKQSNEEKTRLRLRLFLILCPALQVTVNVK